MTAEPLDDNKFNKKNKIKENELESMGLFPDSQDLDSNKKDLYGKIFDLKRKISCFLQEAIKSELYKDYKDAISEYKKAIIPAYEIGDVENLSFTILKISDCLEQSGNLQVAIDFEEEKFNLLKKINAKSEFLAVHHINLIRLYELSSFSAENELDKEISTIKTLDNIKKLSSIPKDYIKGSLIVKSPLKKLLDTYLTQFKFNVPALKRANNIIKICQEIFPTIENSQKDFLEDYSLNLKINIATIEKNINFLKDLLHNNESSLDTFLDTTFRLLEIYSDEGKKIEARDLLLSSHEHLCDLTVFNPKNCKVLISFIAISTEMVSFYCQINDLKMASKYFKILDHTLQKPDSIQILGTDLSKVHLANTKTVKKIYNDFSFTLSDYASVRLELEEKINPKNTKKFEDLLDKILSFSQSDIKNPLIYCNLILNSLETAIQNNEKNTADSLIEENDQLFSQIKAPETCIAYNMAQVDYHLTFDEIVDTEKIFKIFDNVQNTILKNNLSNSYIFFDFTMRKVDFLLDVDDPLLAKDTIEDAQEYITHNNLQQSEEGLSLLELEKQVYEQLGFDLEIEKINSEISSLTTFLEEQNSIL